LKLLSLFGGPSLTPSWTFAPGGTIWRLFPAKSGQLVGESRNEDAKRATFFALDMETGTPLWQNLAFDEPWWIGIEDVTEEVLLLHKFASPDMPQHKGIIGVDLRTGRQLWSNDQSTYWFTHKNSLFVHKMMFEKRMASELDVRSGQLVKEFGEDQEASLFRIREEAHETDQNGISFPDAVELDRVHSNTARIIRKHLPATDVQGFVEFLQIDPLLLLNYFVPSRRSSSEKTLLDNHFKILETTGGRLLYSDTIARGAPAAVPDSFFVHNRIVYYVKDQKILTAIRLSN